MGLENVEQAVHVLCGLLRILGEIDLVAAGAEGGSGCVFERLDRLCHFFIEIEKFLVEDSENPVSARINLTDLGMFSRFLNHTGDTGVDHGRWSPGLGNQ